MATTEMKIMMKERSRIDFNVEELTHIVDGGPEKTALRRKITDDIRKNAVFAKVGGEIVEFQKALEFRKLGLDISDPDIERMFVWANDDLPLRVHRVAFVPSLRKFGTTEQLKKWLPLAMNLHIIGAYGQTELGHGSNIKGLETTATYDAMTGEFIINSPTTSSIKYWPGDLGKRANHVIIMANLIIKGKSYGMNSFIVQIRDLDTHMPLPGIKVGDIGDRISSNPLINDHGFLSLDHVRIPKNNMLSRFAEVDSNGNYIIKKDRKLLYGVMMGLRVGLTVTNAIIPLQKSCTIATRYSIVRRQGALENGDPEIPILDYVAQQQKFFPLLAECYAFQFASKRATNLYKDMIAQVNIGDYTNLPELHALTSGMKAYMTDRCLAGTDVCRRACGGHGYLKASGFPGIYLNQLSTVTYEGENTIMYLQCARYLIKCMTNVLNGKPVNGIASYLNGASKKKFSANSEDDMMQHEKLSQCLKHRAHLLIREAQENLQKLVRSGCSEQEAWNMTSVQLIKMSKAHLEYYVLSSFIKFLETTHASPSLFVKLKEICSLFGLHIINENVGDFLKGLVFQKLRGRDTVRRWRTPPLFTTVISQGFLNFFIGNFLPLQDGYLNSRQATLSNDAELIIFSRIRNYALGIVDAFDFPDKTLNSCIGAYDGNAYVRLFENAKQSARNKSEMHEGFYNLMQPYLHAGRDILEGRKSKL